MDGFNFNDTLWLFETVQYALPTLSNEIAERWAQGRAGEIPKFFEYRPSNPLNG